ncbi:MAG: ABC transporter permease, partial [Actinomycetes bacterium]
MSTAVSSPKPGNPQPGNEKDAGAAAVSAKPVGWKTPVLLAAFGLIALVFFGLLAPNQTASFGISTGSDFFQLPALEVNAFAGGLVLSILLLGLAGYAVYLKTKDRPAPGWLTVAFIVLFVAAFLIWVVGGARTPSISLAGLIAGSVTLAVPLVFGSLSGVLCERVGVVNIAIEGQLLLGAFAAAITASSTGSPWAGLVAAA